MKETHEVTEKTKAALEESIAHWERLLVAYEDRNKGAAIKEGYSAAECALCDLFIDDDCLECPIKADTYYPQCIGTPYAYASLAIMDFLNVDAYKENRHVRNMLEYLKDLNRRCTVTED